MHTNAVCSRGKIEVSHKIAFVSNPIKYGVNTASNKQYIIINVNSGTNLNINKRDVQKIVYKNYACFNYDSYVMF